MPVFQAVGEGYDVEAVRVLISSLARSSGTGGMIRRVAEGGIA
jgi:hypothetical protein